MKECLRKLRGQKITTSIGEIMLGDLFREDCEFDQLYFTTQLDHVVVKAYELKAEISQQRFQYQRQAYQCGKYDELVELLHVDEIVIRKMRFGVIVLKISKNMALRDIASGLSTSQWLGLVENFLSFLARLQNQKKVFINLNPNSIVKNAFGQFRFVDPEYISEQGSYSEVNQKRQGLLDLCQKEYKYKAPEVLDQYVRGKIDWSGDLYSFGIVLYEMRYNEYPFESKLAQINSNYKKVPDDSFFSKMISLVLQPYNKRTTIENIKNLVEKQRINVPKQINSKNMSSGSTVQSKGSNIFSGITQMFSKLTTETEGWFLSYTENDSNRPEQKYLNMIVGKLYKKQAKFQKLQLIIHKYIDAAQVATHQKQIIKIGVFIVQLFRRGPNIMNYAWQDILSIIQVKSKGLSYLQQIYKLCKQKLAVNAKLKNILRGNFYLQDTSKFKNINIQILSILSSHLGFLLQSLSGRLLFLKQQEDYLEYIKELYCDQILDVLSMLILSVICIRADNQLEFRKDNLQELKQIQRSFGGYLKRISYISNHVNGHAIYSLQVDYLFYQQEVELKQKPYYTTLEHFYKNQRQYKGLSIPQNYGLTYCTGDQKEYLSNENNREIKNKINKQYFTGDDQENDKQFKIIEEESPKSKKQLFLQQLQFKDKINKKTNLKQDVNKKIVKEEPKKIVGFQQFFKIQLKKPEKDTKKQIFDFNFDKKQVNVQKKPAKKSDDFSYFQNMTKPPLPPKINKQPQKKPNNNNLFSNFQFLQKPKQKSSLGNSNSQKIITQNIMSYDWLKKNELLIPNKQPTVASPFLNEILSGLKLKQLRQIIVNNQQTIIDFNKLQLRKVIGSGSAGQVYLGKHQNQQVAIKKVKTKQNPNALKQFQRQLLTYIKIKRNPYLVSLVGLSKSQEDYYLLTQFCNSGSLFDLLHKQVNTVLLSWKQRIALANQIARGMLALHEMKPPIIHRDLKSLNVFVIQKQGEYFAKVADFGLSRSPESQMMTMYLGTLHWMAPQLLDNKQYSIKVDIYSYAILLWQICSRKTPYNELSNPMAIIKHVTIQQKRPNLGSIPSDCPPQLIELMKQCWSQQSNIRPSFRDIIQRLQKIPMLL